MVRMPQKHLLHFLRIEAAPQSERISVGQAIEWIRQPFILQGGLLAGSGVTAMHYLGMVSVIGVGVSFDAALVFASWLIAIFAATAALIILFHFEGKMARNASALVMGVAVCSMHYTGMAATKFTYDGSQQALMSDLATRDVGAVVAMIAAFICLGMQSAASSHMQSGIKNYAKLKIEAEQEKIEILRRFLALINFHSRTGCTTSSLEYFIEPDVVKQEFSLLEEEKRPEKPVEDNHKRMAEFRELLNHPVAFEVFKDICVKSLTHENLTFLAEVQFLLKWMKDEPVAERHRIGLSLWKTYLKPDAPRQINISSQLQEEALDSLGKEYHSEEKDSLLGNKDFLKGTEELLKSIEDEIEHLLFANMYRINQFLGSAEYKWCKVLMKHLPMPSYESLTMYRNIDRSTEKEGPTSTELSVTASNELAVPASGTHVNVAVTAVSLNQDA
jgi:hypothetical protein